MRLADALAREALADDRRPRTARPSCSARPRPASTCSRTTPPADAPSRPRSPNSPPSVRPTEPPEDRDEPRPADPPPGPARPRARAHARGAAQDREPAARPHADRVGRPARAPPGRLRDPRRGGRPDRGRHPDGLLVVGDPRLPLERGHVRDRRPADPVGGPRHPRDGRDDEGGLPLPPPGLGAVLHRRRRAAHPGVRPAVQPRRRRLGPLARAAAAAGGPPGRDREAGDGHLPRPLVRQARDQGPFVLGRDARVHDHRGPDRDAGLQGARPRHHDGHRPHRHDDVLRRGRQPRPSRGDGRSPRSRS